MAKQHMAQPCGCLMAAGPGPVWLDRDWHHLRHTTAASTLSQQIQRVEEPATPWIILLYLNNLSFSHFPTCISAIKTASSTGDPAH